MQYQFFYSTLQELLNNVGCISSTPYYYAFGLHLCYLSPVNIMADYIHMALFLQIFRIALLLKAKSLSVLYVDCLSVFKSP